MSELNVLYACDNRYAPFCGVSITSLLMNNMDIGTINIYVASEDIDLRNKKRFEKTACRFGRQISVVDASAVCSKLKAYGVPEYRGSFAANLRMCFDQFVPNDVQRLLYIDSDTLITGSLANLIDIDMGDKCVGMVIDSLGGNYKKLIGFNDKDLYYNSGVILINTTHWKNMQCTRRLVDYITGIESKYCNPDQDLLNIVLKEDIYTLPIKYNMQPVHQVYSNKDYFFNYPKEYYSEREINESKETPVILHTYRFLGDFPWHMNNLHPNSDLFDSYLAQSEWSDLKKQPNHLGFVFDLEKMLFRYMPQPVFLFVFRTFTDMLFYINNTRIR